MLLPNTIYTMQKAKQKNLNYNKQIQCLVPPSFDGRDMVLLKSISLSGNCHNKR